MDEELTQSCAEAYSLGLSWLPFFESYGLVVAKQVGDNQYLLTSNVMLDTTAPYPQYLQSDSESGDFVQLVLKVKPRTTRSQILRDLKAFTAQRRESPIDKMHVHTFV